jgi:hypothetical protein
MLKLHPIFLIFTAFGFIGLLYSISWLGMTDWYASRPAVPPELHLSADESLCEVVNIRLNDADFDLQFGETVLVSPAQTLKLSLAGKCQSDIFRITARMTTRQPLNKLREDETSLLRASIIVRALRKSSLNPGYQVVAAVGSGAKIDSTSQLTWSGSLTAPAQPGEYLVKVVLVTAAYHPQEPPKMTEYFLRSFLLRVSE